MDGDCKWPWNTTGFYYFKWLTTVGSVSVLHGLDLVQTKNKFPRGLYVSHIKATAHGTTNNGVERAGKTDKEGIKWSKISLDSGS